MLMNFNLFMFRSLANLAEVPPPEGFYLRDLPLHYDREARRQDLTTLITQLNEDKVTRKESRMGKQERMRKYAKQNATEQLRGTFRYVDNPDDDEGQQLVGAEVTNEETRPQQKEDNRPDKVDDQLETDDFCRTVTNHCENIAKLLQNRAQDDSVSVDTQTLESILQALNSSQEFISQAQLRLQSVPSKADQTQALHARCSQLEVDLEAASRSRVFCPICLDQAEDIVRTKRTLLSTMCGHVFCNECLHRSLVSAKSGDIKKKVTCPRCRKPLTMVDSHKYAHTLFI